MLDKKYIVSLIFFLNFVNWIFAQNGNGSEAKNYCCNPKNLKILSDSARNWRFTDIRPTEKFDIIFNKGFEIFSPDLDTSENSNQFQKLAINNIGSGTSFVGFSFNWLLTKKITLKIQPGLSFYNISFNTKFKTAETEQFPKEDIIRIQYTAQYFEVPLGVSYVIYRDINKKKLISFLELGAILGVKIGSGLNISFSKLNNIPKPEISISNIPEINAFRAGIYTKVVYRLFGIWAFYRLTDYFQEARGGYNLPQLGKLEIGFSFVL